MNIKTTSEKASYGKDTLPNSPNSCTKMTSNYTWNGPRKHDPTEVTGQVSGSFRSHGMGLPQNVRRHHCGGKNLAGTVRILGLSLASAAPRAPAQLSA